MWSLSKVARECRKWASGWGYILIFNWRFCPSRYLAVVVACIPSCMPIVANIHDAHSIFERCSVVGDMVRV